MYFDWSSLSAKITGLTGRVRCESGWKLDAAWSNCLHDFDLWYVWAGAGHMKTKHADIILRPGICFWMRPGEYYIAEQDDTNRLGVTYLHFDLIDKQERRLSQIPSQKLPPEWFDIADHLFFDALTRKIIQLLQSEVEQGQPEQKVARQTAELLLQSLLFDLDANLSQHATQGKRSQGKRQQQIRDITLQINENLIEVPDIATLAQQMGCSIDHFSRLFKQVMGMSPQAFIIQARINRARYLLANSSLSVSQIAERTGYQDVYFFSRQFKAKTGFSPTTFRHKKLPEKHF